MSDSKSICLVCDRPARSRGYCNPHYQRLLKHGDPLAGRTYFGTPRAFIERLLTEKHHECVTWPFAISSNGYANVKWNGKHVRVSRLICTLAHGDPPNVAMEAAHRCGNGARGCVNPACLYWATRAENEADKILHRTVMIGEKNGQCKLKDSQVDAIRVDNRTQRVIAAEYGISTTQVSRIRLGQSRLTRSVH
jgi:hypothetical protein